MITPLLITKGFIPPARLDVVARPRLLARLNQGMRHRLTLISAPAGFGKTTLLAEWLAEGQKANGKRQNSEAKESDDPLPVPFSLFPFNVAWLSLDEGDADPVRFVAYLAAALERVAPGIEPTIQGVLHNPQHALHPEGIRALLALLINHVAAAADPFALILDDYHAIDDPAVHAIVTFLLDHLPPHAHMMLLTREDPPLPLARLRAGGQLLEIRAEDLKFTEAEARAFLAECMGLDLAPADVAALEARTEGWIAGLQLAALSLQGRKDPRDVIEGFHGDHRYVLDYLAQEVLSQQPEEVQTFMLRTAILNRLRGELCDAVTGQEQGQVTLEIMEAANLFLVPLDENRRWYRYHHLFRDFLREQLRRRHPDAIPDLHIRASAWYEQHGSANEAMMHLLASQNYQRAADLLDRTAESLWTSAQIPLLLDWCGRLPIEVVRARPYLCVCYAWALVIAGQFDSAAARLHDAQLALGADLPEADRDDIQGMIAFVRSAASASPQEALAHARQALALLSDRRLVWRAAAQLSLGIAHKDLGDVHAASEALTTALAENQSAKDSYATLFAMSNLAQVQIAQGQLQAALRTYQDAMRHADDAPEQGRAYLSWAYVGMGQISYERNELDEAARYLEVGQRSQEQIGDAGNLAACYITLAKLRAALGDCAGALDTAQRAQQASAHWNWTQLELNVAAQQARLFMRCGDLPAAERWIAQRQLGPNNAVPGWREVEYLTLARALIALQAPEQATSLLERLVHGAEAAGRIASLIEGLLALAVAQHAQGDPRAMATLQRALALAEPEGYVRTFVDEGAPVAVLLRDAHAHGIVPNYVARLLAAFREGLEARDLWLADALPASSLKPQASTLIEPLTDRELEVLRLLAEGLSNQEISAALVLALGTVKRHTNSIYGKLGVRSRMQAVVRARELALL